MGAGSPIVVLLLFLLAAPAILHPAALGKQVSIPGEVGLPAQGVIVQQSMPAAIAEPVLDLDTPIAGADSAIAPDGGELFPVLPAAYEAAPVRNIKPDLVPPTAAETRAKGLLAPLATLVPALPAVTRPQTLAYRAGGPAPIAAADILANAGRLLGTPYVWGGNTDAGLDCSSFVSRAWKVSRQTTDSIHTVSIRIAKDELMPGDALNMTIAQDTRGYGHIRLFDRWVNAEHTLMWVYEETPPRAIHRVITYDSRYTPIRRFNYLVSADGSVPTLPDQVRALVGAIQNVAAGPSGSTPAAAILTGPVVEAPRPGGAAQPSLSVPPSIPHAEHTPRAHLPEPTVALPTPKAETRRDSDQSGAKPGQNDRPAPEPTPVLSRPARTPTPIPSPQPPVIDEDDLLPTPNARRRATPMPSRRTPTPIVTPPAPWPTPQPASPTPPRPSPTPQRSSPTPVAPRPDPTPDPTAARPPVATATPGKPADSVGAGRSRQESTRPAQPSPTPKPRVDSQGNTKAGKNEARPAQPTPAPKANPEKSRGEKTGDQSKGRK